MVDNKGVQKFTPLSRPFFLFFTCEKARPMISTLREWDYRQTFTILYVIWRFRLTVKCPDNLWSSWPERSIGFSYCSLSTEIKFHTCQPQRPLAESISQVRPLLSLPRLHTRLFAMEDNLRCVRHGIKYLIEKARLAVPSPFIISLEKSQSRFRLWD